MYGIVKIMKPIFELHKTISDAMCVFDAKRNPLPLDKEHKDAIK